MEHPENRSKGRVKFYNRKYRFGFVIVDESGEEIYFKRSYVVDEVELDEDDAVTFVIGEAKRGPVAKEIQKL